MRIDKYVFKGYPKQDVPEKRFLVSFKNLEILNRLSSYQVADILDCQESAEVRTRKISIDGKEHYFRTVSHADAQIASTANTESIANTASTASEDAISKADFEQSCEKMYHLYRLVHRVRYAFSDGIVSAVILAGIPVKSDEARGVFMMLDTFDLWNGFGILTIKGSKVVNLDYETLEVPGFEIVKEITNDKTYFTKSISTIDYTSFLE